MQAENALVLMLARLDQPNPCASITQYAEAGDVDGLMRALEEFSKREDSKTELCEFTWWTVAFKAVAKHGTVEQMQTFLTYPKPPMHDGDIMTNSFAMEDALDRGKFDMFHLLRHSLGFIIGNVVAHCIRSDSETDWYFEEFTVCSTSLEDLRSIAYLLSILDGATEDHLTRFFDRVDDHIPKSREMMRCVYAPLLRECLNSRSITELTQILVRRILKEKRCSPEFFLEQTRDNYTLLHAAANSCNAGFVSIVLEFVDSEAKRVREVQYGRTPIELYYHTRSRRFLTYDPEIISLLTPLPTKSAHE